MSVPAKKASRRPVGRTPGTADKIRGLLTEYGVKGDIAEAIVDRLNRDFEFGSVERIERLSMALTDWIEENATVGKRYACSTTEAILTLQHVAYKIFDSMRATDIVTDISKRLEQRASNDGSENTQPAQPQPKPRDVPDSIYR